MNIDWIRAVVRPLWALTAAGVFATLALTKVLPVEATTAIMMAVVIFYFKSRDENKS